MYWLYVLSVDRCYDGDITLDNYTYMDYPIGRQEYSGRVQICVDREFVDVCPGAIDVGLVCSYLGFPGAVLKSANSLYIELHISIYIVYSMHG